MAVFEFIPVPAGTATKTNVAGASSAAIVLGASSLFMFTADADMWIKFGNSGMGAAANTDFYIPAKTPIKFDMGQSCDRLRVFGTGNFYIQPISKS